MKIIKDGNPERVVFEKLCLCGCDFEFTASEIKWPIGFNTEGNPNLFGTVECPCCGLVRIVQSIDRKER